MGLTIEIVFAACVYSGKQYQGLSNHLGIDNLLKPTSGHCTYLGSQIYEIGDYLLGNYLFFASTYMGLSLGIMFIFIPETMGKEIKDHRHQHTAEFPLLGKGARHTEKPMGYGPTLNAEESVIGFARFNTLNAENL